MSDKKRATLILEDGRRFQGFLFGAHAQATGRVVFNTAMAGYPEIMTDPASAGQILVMTYPLLGNYGISGDEREYGLARNFESDVVHVRALVVTDYSPEPSHWNARESLEEWMKENGVVGIHGVDTRALTRHIRKHGSMAGVIVPEGAPETLAEVDEPAVVSCSEAATYGEGKGRVALIDCGCANSTIRELVRRGLTVVRLPWNADLDAKDFDAVVVAGGESDPAPLGKTVENIRKAMEAGKPVMGVNLGHILLAQAAGAGVDKLKFGHHGHNQPVIEVGTHNTPITNQNHLRVVDPKTLGADWEVWYENLNDGSCEGIRHRSKPFFSVQFTPNEYVYNLLMSKL